MALENNLIEEIKNRANIIDIVTKYIVLQKRGANYLGLCPFHQEKTPSLTVSPSKNIWHCFGCGEGGNVFNFLMKINNWSFREALEFVAHEIGMDVPNIKIQKEKEEKYAFLYDQFKKECLAYHHNLFSDSGKIFLDYLVKRDIKKDTIKKFMLGYANSGYFNNRLIFPIFDIQSRCLAFGGRILSEEKGTAKYINSKESPIYIKGNHLYALNLAQEAIRKNDQIIIVEGYMDVIACHQSGFENVVAVLGTALTKNQAYLIKRFTKNIILAFDGDLAGKKATFRSLDILKEFEFNIKVASFKGKDPDETIKNFGKEELIKNFKEAMPRMEYQIQVIVSSFDMSSIESKEKILQAVKKIIAQESSFVQEEALKYLANILKIDPYKLINDFGIKTKMLPRYNKAKITVDQKDISNKKFATLEALISFAIEDTVKRKLIFEYFLPSDFLEEPYITIAQTIKNIPENINLDKFVLSLDDELGQKIREIILNTENKGKLSDYLKNLIEYKIKILSLQIKQAIDQDIQETLQKEKLSLMQKKSLL